MASSAETDHLRDVTDEMPVHQMNLHDSESDNEFVDSHVIPEDACTVNTDRDRLKTLCEATSSAESSCTIIPYYLNVFDEPANQEEDYSHVTKLLRDYEKKEGYRVHDAEYSTE